MKDIAENVVALRALSAELEELTADMLPHGPAAKRIVELFGEIKDHAVIGEALSKRAAIEREARERPISGAEYTAIVNGIPLRVR